jgi:hypothetical protein
MYYVLEGVVCFALGLVFHRYVISEAQSVKAHITNEIELLRRDLGLAIAGGTRNVANNSTIVGKTTKE